MAESYACLVFFFDSVFYEVRRLHCSYVYYRYADWCRPRSPDRVCVCVCVFVRVCVFYLGVEHLAIRFAGVLRV